MYTYFKILGQFQFDQNSQGLRAHQPIRQLNCTPRESSPIKKHVQVVYLISQKDEADTKSIYLRQKLAMMSKGLGFLLLLKLQKAVFI